MLRSEFSDIVVPLTSKEKRYKLNPDEPQTIYQFMDSHMVDSEQVYTFVWNNSSSVRNQYAILTDREEYEFLQHPHLFLSKQTRFASVPSHHHNYFELNYVYSGSCDMIINGKAIKLKTGDVCLMERDVVHSIAALEEKDILLNGMIKHSYFDMHLMNRLSQSGPVAHFLADEISYKTVHNKYLIIQTSELPQFRETIENICCEFLDPNLCSVNMIDSYMILLFIQLARCYQSTKEDFCEVDESNYMMDLLRYIETHYDNCTLNEVAAHFGFHPNYLSRAIRHATGLSFKEHVNQARLNRAKYLLRYSDESISEIAAQCGWSNINQFYKKFNDAYGITPSKYRKESTAVNN